MQRQLFNDLFKSVSVPSRSRKKLKIDSCLPQKPIKIEVIDTNICLQIAHFRDFVSTKGGERHTPPPSVFPGVSISCLNQTNPQPRVIGSFENFECEFGKRFKYFYVRFHNDDLMLTGKLGLKIEKFVHFEKDNSPFGFLILEEIEKDEGK